MKNLVIAVRSLFKQGRHNLMKIGTLSIGLAVGLVLIAKVYFEQSYDTFYPDSDRIYRLTESIEKQDGNVDYEQVAGAVAPGMKAEVPGVEAATRLTYIAGPGTTFTTSEKQRYSADFILMADSNVFDVFPRPILLGNPKEVLARPNYAMISRSLAEKMGGVEQVDGVVIAMDYNPGRTYVIGGVFEDIPENSHLHYDMLVSLNGMNEWSRTNWVGNDRYLGYVRLMPGITPESLKPAIHEMQLRHIDQEEMSRAGVELTFYMKPLLEMHSGSDNVKNMMLMLSVLAFALLFTAVMNYILIAISSIINRTKEVAVHKSYGASEKNIHSMIMSETFVHMLIALALAVFLIFLCQDVVKELLNVSVSALFYSKGTLLLLAVCVVVFFLTGFVPGVLFARIPVAAAFRNFRESKRIWKLCLLFFQFVAGGLLVSLLLVVTRQHTYMVNSNPGYSYEKLAYCDISGLDSTARAKVIEEMRRLPEIEKVSTSDNLPLYSMSGNNISLPGSDEELFNVADQYDCGNGFLDLMEIPVIEGRSFTENIPFSTEIMVNRAFAEKMENVAHWTSVVGKEIQITDHGYRISENAMESSTYTICGIYENYRIGSLIYLDNRPSVLFYNSYPSSNLLLNFNNLDADAIEKANDKLQELMPNLEPKLSLFSEDIVNLYSSSRKFQDQLWIGGLVTLLISIIGLIGYTNDEISRRRKEIAIRKVNGATLLEIQRIFLLDVMRIAVPAAFMGGALAYVLAIRWQQQFIEKVPLNIGIFLLGSLFVILVVTISVIYRIWFAANSNPVESLKSE
ncbi:ABC transporter permease [Parabacteroides sp. AM08-6]|uniref:ABC transporter permease n=1 Tax=Parabacteroides sp. AM08-6 TaxID=2292053 RepID=UPI000EFFD49D|nr:FtsX-like permease family protein [Parabacteroides sp. AM08-6]RHJ78896.1 ABC transporter permease [Parabacteroides sp. AM08-6]